MRLFQRKKKKESTADQGTSLLFFAPSRSELLESIERVIWVDEQNMVRYYTYSVYSNDYVDGRSCLNLYGQSILNALTQGENK